MPARLTTESFIKKASAIHNNKYDYSLTNYQKGTLKVDIICPEHKVFSQRASSHLEGHGCSKCAGKNLTNSEWIAKAGRLHGHQYTYEKTHYVNALTKLIITCPTHGDFQLTANDHMNSKYGCQKCARNYKYSTEEWISEARKVHGNKYDYSKVLYETAKAKIVITCLRHGDFTQTPNDHLNGETGCSVCTTYSKGERKIATFLKDRGLHFIPQKSFDNLVDQCKLRYDFFLPASNILVEYDGRHHFEPVRFGGISHKEASQNFQQTVRRDRMKQEYARAHNFELIRISYKDFKRIDTILGELLDD